MRFCHSIIVRYVFSKVDLSSLVDSVTGIVQLLQLPLVLNQEVVVMGKFKLREMLQTIVRYRCEELWLVPRE